MVYRSVYPTTASGQSAHRRRPLATWTTARLRQIVAGWERFAKRPGRSAAVVFIACALLYAKAQWQPTWNDPDGFYHARMSEFLQGGVFVRQFPWLSQTVISRAYADEHLLYHLLVALLGQFWPVPVAMKIMAVTAAASAVTALYLLQRSLNSPLPLLWTAFFGLSGVAAVRLNLPKSDAIAVLLQLAIVAVLLAAPRGRAFIVFGLAWLYGLAHGSWPLAVLIVGLFALVDILTARPRTWRSRVAALGQQGPVLLAVVAGASAGVVLNPYFPENLAFAWHQIFEIAVLGGPPELLVGAEWYPLPWEMLFAESAPLMLGVPLGVAVALVALRRGRLDLGSPPVRQVLFLGLCALVGCILMLKSARFGVLGVLYLSLFGGALWRVLLDEVHDLVHPLTQRLRSEPIAGGLLLTAVTAYLLLGPVTIVRLMQGGLPWTYLRGAATHLARHSAPGEIVYNVGFDLFPPLFYWNSKNYYISGLDPRFMHRFDPQGAMTYQKSRPTTTELRELFDRFSARYAVVTKMHPDAEVQAVLRKDRGHFVAVYEDGEAVVFERVHPRPPLPAAHFHLPGAKR